MNDFFGRLELELRAAAERPQRRTARLTDAGPELVAIVAVAACLAIALIPVLVILGSGDDGGRATRSGERPEPKPAPVGTVIPAGDGGVPAAPGESAHTVVATGNAPVSGPWQMEHSRSGRQVDAERHEIVQQRGTPCLTVVVLSPPPIRGQRNRGDESPFPSGYCGERFPGTPGFSRAQISVPPRHFVRGRPRPWLLGVREVLVYGRAPERASRVVITARGQRRFTVKTFEGPRTVRGDFYLIPVPPSLRNARVNWLDRDGNPGSPGIRLQHDTKGRIV